MGCLILNLIYTADKNKSFWKTFKDNPKQLPLEIVCQFSLRLTYKKFDFCKKTRFQKCSFEHKCWACVRILVKKIYIALDCTLDISNKQEFVDEQYRT